jgi:hypothetical protein
VIRRLRDHAAALVGVDDVRDDRIGTRAGRDRSVAGARSALFGAAAMEDAAEALEAGATEVASAGFLVVRLRAAVSPVAAFRFVVVLRVLLSDVAIPFSCLFCRFVFESMLVKDCTF